MTSAEYAAFCSRHNHLPCFIPEPNDVMANSYLLLDEYMRFLDKGPGGEKASRSILEVGVQEGLKEVRWDQEKFYERGGVYEWAKEMEGGSGGGGCGGEGGKELEW